jgi:hypothetical protein
VLESTAGQVAIVATRRVLEGCSGLTPTLRQQSEARDTIALCVVVSDTHAAREELVELTRQHQAIAVPRALAGQLQGLTVTGELVQTIERTVAETLLLLSGKASTVAALRRGAPRAAAEAPENLSAREQWFRKRESDG